jgi:hypothetical protein
MIMSKLKIAEIRTNSKSGIVQIKMNRGPNYTLKGEAAVRFEKLRNAYICDNNSHSIASLLAAQNIIEGI